MPPLAPITAVAASFTTVDNSTVDATYGSQEQAVIGNNRTRVGELVTAVNALVTAVNEIITALETADLVRKN
jgi:hypothetical protein